MADLFNKDFLDFIEVKYIHINHLVKAKKAAGRFKDKNDIEQLLKKSKKF